MTEKMSRWGTGPLFAGLSAGYGIVAMGVNHIFHPFFTIDMIPYWLLKTIGIALIIIGLPFFIVSVKTLHRAYNADKLVTDGVYRFCRHPLYASWVVFIVPGIVVAYGSWLGLTTPVFMYVILRWLVGKEETYLESVFGAEYQDYKKAVPCILPFGPFRALTR